MLCLIGMIERKNLRKCDNEKKKTLQKISIVFDRNGQIQPL